MVVTEEQGVGYVSTTSISKQTEKNRLMRKGSLLIQRFFVSAKQITRP
jgi:hypothetical protein